MKRIKIVGKITNVEFKSISVEGIPSFYVTFEDTKGNVFQGSTKVNAECNYNIMKPEYKNWCYINFHYTNKSNTIVDYTSRIYPMDKIDFRFTEHTFSKNRKLNELCNDIYDYILDKNVDCDNSYADVIEELKRYKRDYPEKVDYNYLDNGNLFCYADNAKKLLEARGYKTNRMNQQQMWDKFRPIVRTVIDFILDHEMEIV